VAFAIARIIERDRAPLAGKMLELQPPNRFVRTNAVEEDNRQMFAAAGLLIADLDSQTRLDAPHHPYLGTMAPPALASPNDSDDGQQRGGPLQDRPRYAPALGTQGRFQPNRDEIWLRQPRLRR